MSFALHSQPTVWVALFVLAVLALVFLVIPAAVGLLLHRGRGGKDKS